MFDILYKFILPLNLKCINFSAATTKHALEHGFRTVLVEDACRGVDEKDITGVKEEILRQGAIIVNSDEVCIVSVSDGRHYCQLK